MLNSLIIVFANIVIGFVYASFFEWAFHRYIMHGHGHKRLFNKLSWIKDKHVEHHSIFGTMRNNTYHIGPGVDKFKITMAWWHGFALTAIALIPFLAEAAVLAVYFGWYWTALSVITSGVFVGGASYAMYEYSHWCMHMPSDRMYDKTRLHLWLDERHKRHHENWRMYYNVALPFADWFFSCSLWLIRKSPFAHLSRT